MADRFAIGYAKSKDPYPRNDRRLVRGRPNPKLQTIQSS